MALEEPPNNRADADREGNSGARLVQLSFREGKHISNEGGLRRRGFTRYRSKAFQGEFVSGAQSLNSS
jgi:hypothetical protein